MPPLKARISSAMVGRLKVDIMVARNRLKAIQSTSGDRTNRAALICYPVRSPGVDTAATVTLYLPEPLRSYCGGIAELPVTARTLLELLHRIEQTQPSLYPNICDETGAVRRHLNIFVNADNMRDLDGLQTALTNGDVVTVVPAVSGG
jgi:sulfur-carrier protein